MADTPFGLSFGNPAKYMGSSPLAEIGKAAKTGLVLYGLQQTGAIDALDKLGVKPKEIRVTGGGAKSAAWRQIMADVFGLPVVAMKEDEGAALGAAIQSAWCRARAQGNTKAKLTEFTQGVVALNEKTRCKPIKSHVMYYAKMQALHNELSHTLRPLFEAHKALRT
jgi:xylulokinase